MREEKGVRLQDFDPRGVRLAVFGRKLPDPELKGVDLENFEDRQKFDQ